MTPALCIVLGLLQVVPFVATAAPNKRPLSALAGKVKPAAARPSAAPTAAPAPGTAITAPESAALVDAHNAVRAEVGAGPVTWDAALARFAQGYVQALTGTCTLAHSQNSGYGENLAGWTAADAPVTQAVDQWAAEKPKYTGGGGAYQGVADGAGHYTQVVWAASTRIGCGRVVCSKEGRNWTIVSCNYSPPGNMLGAKVY